MTVAFEIKHGFGCKIHEKKTITYKEEETKKNRAKKLLLLHWLGNSTGPQVTS
jgi:hypothetical protein